jgi:hypothetical protein
VRPVVERAIRARVQADEEAERSARRPARSPRVRKPLAAPASGLRVPHKVQPPGSDSPPTIVGPKSEPRLDVPPGVCVVRMSPTMIELFAEAGLLRGVA